MNKVFFLLSTLSGGGGERVASDLSLGLADKIDLKIVLLHDNVAYPYKGEVVHLNIPESDKIFGRIKAFAKFRALVKKENPDYVVSFGKFPNIINLFSGSRAIVRVDNFYSSSCIGFSGWMYKKMVRLFFNRAQKIVVISRESANDLTENFGVQEGKIQVIYNPLNLAKIQELVKEELDQKHQRIFENPIMITVGQLGKQKNQIHLIEAFLIAKREIPNLQLVILGRGPLQDNLKDKARELSVSNSIHFLGWQKNPFKFISKSKVFVLSSLWEGLPCSLLEAMACLVPVISYDCSSGPREILSPQTIPTEKTNGVDYAEFGILTKPGDPELLAKAIITLFLDSPLYIKLKNKSQQRAMDFDLKNIIYQWNFLFKRS